MKQLNVVSWLYRRLVALANQTGLVVTSVKAYEWGMQGPDAHNEIVKQHDGRWAGGI